MKTHIFIQKINLGVNFIRPVHFYNFHAMIYPIILMEFCDGVNYIIFFLNTSTEIKVSKKMFNKRRDENSGMHGRNENDIANVT